MHSNPFLCPSTYVYSMENMQTKQQEYIIVKNTKYLNNSTRLKFIGRNYTKDMRSDGIKIIVKEEY